MELVRTAALITGGASGLGAAAARALAAAGCMTVVADVDGRAGAKVAADIGGRFVRLDVTDEASMTEAVEVAAGMGVPLRVAVACAGIGPGERTLHPDASPHSEELFRRVIEVNQVGTFHLLRLAASKIAMTDPLTDGERGVVIMTSSIAAFDGQGGTLAYSASKGAVTGMTLPAARDLQRFGIRVCTIAPGAFDTPMLATATDSKRAELAGAVVFPRRLGKPDEFGALVRVIAEISYLNGEVIRLDGGLRMGPS